MKGHTFRGAIPAIGIAAAVTFGGVLAAQTQTDKPQGHRHMMMMGEQEKGGMMEECQAMMQKHKEMMQKQGAMETELDSLVATMNSARGDAKIDAMAALLAKLVEQRKAMHGMMGEMQPMMMGHMARHMEMGGSQGMMGCPMMKGMMGEESEGGHEAHH